MKKIVKHSIWMAANVAALPVVGALSAVTGDSSEVAKVTDNIAKHASKISKKIEKRAAKKSETPHVDLKK